MRMISARNKAGYVAAPFVGPSESAGVKLGATGFGFMVLATALVVTTALAADEPAPAQPPKANPAFKGAVEAPAGGVATNAFSSVGSLLGLSETQQQEVLGAISAKIKSLDVLSSRGLDNPLVRARFEKYLDAAAADQKQVDQYLALVRQIRDELKRREFRIAWKQLAELSTYEWDAGIGEALAAQVASTFDMKLTQQEIEEKITKLKKDVELANWNTDMMLSNKSLTQGEKPRVTQPPRRSGTISTNNAAFNVDGDINDVTGVGNIDMTLAPGKMRALQEYVKMLEARGKITTSEFKSGALEAQNRFNFQAYVTTLFTSRRHLHTIVAADFYRALFGGGDYPASMATQVNVASEALRDVEQAVSVYKYKMDNNELSGAYEHLQYAFAASEFHPALQTLSRDSKRKVRAFGVNVVKLQNRLEARDFGNCEPLLKDMEAQAADFDATKARSIVDAVKLQSRLRLGAARLAAQQGDLKTAMGEFRAAAETWPGNPDLDIAQLGFFNSQDVKTQLQMEFDRLADAKNFRSIFDKQLQLATALLGDVKRSDLMKSALEKVKGAEMAIEKANIFKRNGNAFGAWEALEMAARDWPDDSVLNKMRAEVSGESAEFVHQLKKGEEAEKTGEHGYALACFLNAQRLYPSSELAKTAVDRLTTQILKRNGAKTAASL